MTTPTKGSVENEGCHLAYWYQGTGPLLIMIPGAGSQAQSFFPIMPYLDKHFTVASFDRRQMGASRVASPRPLNPVQQARDVVAIVKAMGKTKTSIFGNSGGGVIAFQLAISFPEVVDQVICHEAPSMSLLPDSTHYLNWCYEVFELHVTKGMQAAMDAFRSEFRGFSPDDPPRSDCEPEDWAMFWHFEFLVFTIFGPDLRKIKDNGVSIAVAAGVKSGDAFYARSTFPQAEIIGCPRLMFPGNHGGFEMEPKEFAESLLDAFKLMEKKQTV